jgi:hypothetical protein
MDTGMKLEARRISPRSSALTVVRRRARFRGLGRPAAEEDALVEHPEDPGEVLHGEPERVDEVGPGVAFDARPGHLAPGQHHRLAQPLQPHGEGRRRIGQGVGAVGDDETLIARIELTHRIEEAVPVPPDACWWSRCCTCPISYGAIWGT